MKIIVKIHYPNSIVSIELDYVLASDTIESIKQKIYDKQGLATRLQRLVFASKALESQRTLEDYLICKQQFT